MPKTKVTPRLPEDVPIWDELVAELGDPRPYEPTEVGTVTVTDESCVDDAGFDDQYTMLDDAARDIHALLDEIEVEATLELDALYPWPKAAESVDPEATVTSPLVGTLDVESTVVLPVWPTDREVRS